MEQELETVEGMEHQGSKPTYNPQGRAYIQIPNQVQTLSHEKRRSQCV